MKIETADRNTAQVWKIFKLICSIPHPSGHESELAEVLADLAQSHGLAVRCDRRGNLFIRRAAARGYENAPRVVMQGHIDMVPQKTEDTDFDFLRDPVKPVINDGFVHACGTTLGADDGIGVAIALAMLFDDQLKCGELAAILTVSEETGLDGARYLAPSDLDYDMLLNLDSEEEGIFYIGCAGGVHLEAEFPAEPLLQSSGSVGIKITLSGLRGGHSGSNIADRRGNAIKLLGRVLEEFPFLRPAMFDGGTLDNAIPRKAELTAECPANRLKDLTVQLDRLRSRLAAEFDAPSEFALTLAPASSAVRPVQCGVFGFINACPDGPAGYDDKFNVVKTSDNLAVVRTKPDRIAVELLLRSQSQAELDALTEQVSAAVIGNRGTVTARGGYPCWEPDEKSSLLAQASALYCRMFGRTPEVKVIHAGLECGIFRGKSDIDMLSLGPTLFNPHSPDERLEVSSVERVTRFVHALLNND
ncbi:MAG: beta-Ala-His dipeptidase [Victivallaceae bacterium]|nr:beta-Ala-His dipeptidase [Victivallaceae bacterium]